MYSSMLTSDISSSKYLMSCLFLSCLLSCKARVAVVAAELMSEAEEEEEVEARFNIRLESTMPEEEEEEEAGPKWWL